VLRTFGRNRTRVRPTTWRDAIGYRLIDDAQEALSYGVRLNPVKTDQRTMKRGDRIIALAKG
jgi:hypothetical protein